MQPIGLIKCEACGGKSYFREKFATTCACYVGFAGMKKDEDCEMYSDELPDDVVVVYWEFQNDETVKSYLEARSSCIK